MSFNACIFCSIVRGDIPASVVYEDEQVLAFLDIEPIQKGHVLVIPKLHVTNLLDVPEELYGPLFRAAQRVARAQKEGLGAHGVNLLQNNGSAAGQVIDHVHLHLIPRYEGDGLHWSWQSDGYENRAESQETADKIKRVLDE